MPQRRDLTIDEAVRDPMIRLVMKADGDDPRAFEKIKAFTFASPRFYSWCSLHSGTC